MAFAVLTGIMIGGYTFLDGSGLRRSGSALSYIVWHTFLTGIPIVCITLWRRRGRVLPFLAREGRKGVLAGVVATLGYAIVLWAMERGALAMVSALRETSVIFAALIGSLLLGEPFGRRRMQAALGVVTGVALIILAG